METNTQIHGSSTLGPPYRPAEPVEVPVDREGKNRLEMHASCPLIKPNSLRTCMCVSLVAVQKMGG
jgi:hypothetical protein